MSCCNPIAYCGFEMHCFYWVRLRRNVDIPSLEGAPVPLSIRKAVIDAGRMEASVLIQLVRACSGIVGVVSTYAGRGLVSAGLPLGPRTRFICMSEDCGAAETR